MSVFQGDQRIVSDSIASFNSFRNNEREIAYVLEHSGASVILVDYEFVHLVPKELPSRITVIVSNDTGGRDGIKSDPYEQFLQGGREIWNQLEEKERKQWGAKARKGWELIDIVENENDACCLCYTSGTTGRPKGVLTTHRGSYLAAIANAFESRLDSSSVYLWTLPLLHAAGWTFPWSVTAALSTHYILRKVDNDKIWNALLNNGVSHFCAAPTVLIGLVNNKNATKLPVRVTVAIAASAPTASLLEKLEQLGFASVHVYGQTENYGPFTKRYFEPAWSELSVEDRAKLMARQGHGFLVVDEVRVIKRASEEDEKVTTGDNEGDRELIDVARDGKEIGEIIMRGNLAMREYYNDKEATAKTIKHGWLHTGDLAVRYPGGEIFIADRAKDIIISGGENISSLMVESELASHEDVLESCVVARNHEKWGEVGHAFIVLKQGKAKDIEKLKSHCRSRMSKVRANASVYEARLILIPPLFTVCSANVY